MTTASAGPPLSGPERASQHSDQDRKIVRPYGDTTGAGRVQLSDRKSVV